MADALHTGQTPFGGRGRAVAALGERLHAAGRGRCDVALVAGEPSIGKTHVAEELAVEARAHGALVLWGRCDEGEGAPAFSPWVAIMMEPGGARGPAADGP